ncbi:MAG: hypothetical protein ACOYM0_07105 [Bacteroidales bacterium]
MQVIKYIVYKKKLKSLLSFLAGTALMCFLVIACISKSTEPTPIRLWVDEGADSAKLNILVQTPQGLILVNQYVNLALSRDSLANSIRVRSERTSIAGKAIFSKLYPRIIYYNCFAVTNGQSFFGSGSARMLPGMTKDTTLIVH